MKKEKQKGTTIQYPWILKIFTLAGPVFFIWYHIKYFKGLFPVLLGGLGFWACIYCWIILSVGIILCLISLRMFSFKLILDKSDIIYRDMLFQNHCYKTYDIQKIKVKTHWDHNTAATFHFIGKGGKKLFSVTGNQDLIRWAGIHGISLKKLK